MGSRTETFLRRAADRPAPAKTGRPGDGAIGGRAGGGATIVALLDLAADDTRVVKAARALAGADAATMVLLHVARPVARRPRGRDGMLATEMLAQRAMRRLAGRRLPPSLSVWTSVRFGDAAEQVAKATVAVGATAVVAASRPARWWWWRSRDRRLRRHLDVPLFLVPAGGGEREGGPAIGRPASPDVRRTGAAA